MKLLFITLLSSMFVLFSCDEGSGPTTSNTDDCTALLTDLTEKSQAFGIALGESLGGGEWDASVCTAYASSAQAFVDDGCTMCPENSEVCEDDQSNADTCCDEIDQDGVDGITLLCGG